MFISYLLESVCKLSPYNFNSHIENRLLKITVSYVGLHYKNGNSSQDNTDHYGAHEGTCRENNLSRAHEIASRYHETRRSRGNEILSRSHEMLTRSCSRDKIFSACAFAGTVDHCCTTAKTLFSIFPCSLLS